MAQLTNYTEGKVLDVITGDAAFATPTTYLALFTAAPTDAGGGTEAAFTGYARQATAAKWAAAAGTPRTKANNAIVAFPTAGSGPTTVTHWGLFDALSAGNLLWWGALTSSVTINNGDTAQFASGALVLGVD